MNKANICAIAFGLALSAGAMAQSMNKDDYKARKAVITADFKSAKAACKSFSANAKDICMVEAAGKEKVSRAELEAAYKPGQKTIYNARVAMANADYAVAKEKCDDQAGNMKAVCVKEAKAVQTSARANAKAQMKIAVARDVAITTSANARLKSSDKAADARKEAATDKRDADYAVAKEKCDAFAGDAKARCMTDAKARYGKT